MATERIFYCDGPECERHVRTAASRPASGMLFITGSGGSLGSTLHFCGWDCVMRYAATKEPEEVFPFDSGEGETS